MKRIICMVLVFALIAAPSALAEGHREFRTIGAGRGTPGVRKLYPVF